MSSSKTENLITSSHFNLPPNK